MNKSEIIKEVKRLRQEIIDLKPANRLTSDDIEDVSDNYQEHLEYKWFVREQLDKIQQLESSL